MSELSASSVSAAVAGTISASQNTTNSGIIALESTGSGSAVIQTSSNDFATTDPTSSHTFAATNSTVPSPTDSVPASSVPDGLVRIELSTAAKVGIGVAVGTAALLLIGALILFIRARRNQGQASQKWFWKKDKVNKESKGCLGPYQDKSWAAGRAPDWKTSQEALGIAELSSDSCTHELDGRSHLTSELHGNSCGR